MGHGHPRGAGAPGVAPDPGAARSGVPTLILVLDDGETWEPIQPASQTTIVRVTARQFRLLEEGRRVRDVLHGLRGTRLASIVAGANLGSPLAGPPIPRRP